MALKDQLEAAGYDTSGLNENDLLTKLDGAGYDTSSLKSGTQSVGQKLWSALDVPQQKASEGLKTIADAVPEGKITGNLPADILRGTPKIAADTLAQVAPSFVSKASLLTAGAGAGIKALGSIPAVSGMASKLGQTAASQLESSSGAAEGTLKTIAKDPSLYLAKGRDAASKLYEAGKAEMDKGASIFAGKYDPKDIIDTGKDFLGKGGQMEPAEALIYRKAIDKALKSGKFVKDELFTLRDEANTIAKQSTNIAAADPLHARAVQAESARSFLPKTTTGRTAQLRTGLLTLPATWPLFSPAVQSGMAAAGGGLVRGLSPTASQIAAPAAIEAMNRLYQRRKKS